MTTGTEGKENVAPQPAAEAAANTGDAGAAQVRRSTRRGPSGSQKTSRC